MKFETYVSELSNDLPVGCARQIILSIFKMNAMACNQILCNGKFHTFTKLGKMNNLEMSLETRYLK